MWAQRPHDAVPLSGVSPQSAVSLGSSFLLASNHCVIKASALSSCLGRNSCMRKCKGHALSKLVFIAPVLVTVVFLSSFVNIFFFSATLSACFDFFFLPHSLLHRVKTHWRTRRSVLSSMQLF